MSEEKYTLRQYAAMQGGHEMPKESEEPYLEFINSLGEARMFRTRDMIQKQGARTLTDHFFVSMMSLYAMANDYKYAPVAKEYARRTSMFSNWNKPSPSGTDLYQTIHSTLKPKGLADSDADKLLLTKVNVEQKRIRNFLKQIESGKINSGQAQAFFYRLEKNLAIQDPKLRAARRLVGEWDTLNTTQRQLAASQLTKYYRLNARRSDLNPIFTKYANEQGLEIDAKKKGSIGKRIARGAAAFAAGYTAGKMTGM